MAAGLKPNHRLDRATRAFLSIGLANNADHKLTTNPCLCPVPVKSMTAFIYSLSAHHTSVLRMDFQYSCTCRGRMGLGTRCVLHATCAYLTILYNRQQGFSLLHIKYFPSRINLPNLQINLLSDPILPPNWSRYALERSFTQA